MSVTTMKKKFATLTKAADEMVTALLQVFKRTKDLSEGFRELINFYPESSVERQVLQRSAKILDHVMCEHDSMTTSIERETQLFHILRDRYLRSSDASDKMTEEIRKMVLRWNEYFHRLSKRHSLVSNTLLRYSTKVKIDAVQKLLVTAADTFQVMSEAMLELPKRTN